MTICRNSDIILNAAALLRSAPVVKLADTMDLGSISERNAGSSPVRRTIYVRQKRYYARKRLDKATCGHISCPKSEMHFHRYFLRENGLEPPCIKYSYGILCTLHNQPANAENGTRRLFLFPPKNTKKIFGRFEPLSCRKTPSIFI